MSDQYGFSDSTKGAIAAGFSVGYCLGLLPTGAASSVGSPKRVLLGGLIFWSLAQAASPAAAAVSVPALLFARAMMGVGEAAAVPSLQAVAARFVPASKRSAFWGCLTASLACGTIGAYEISPPLIENYGWASAFEVYGATGLVLALCWAVWGADGPKTALESVGTSSSPPAPPALELSDVPWRGIATSRPVWALAAAHSSANFFMYFGLSWLPTYFSYQFGLSASDASYAALLPFAAGAVGSLSSGLICDALTANAGFSLTRARKLMQSIGLGGPMIAMAALFALSSGFGGLELDRNEAETLFIVGVGCNSCSSAGYGCGAQDIATRFSSLIYGATSVVAVLFGASGQYLTGYLLEQNGRDFAPIFAAVVAIEVAGLIAWNSWWDSERAFE